MNEKSPIIRIESVTACYDRNVVLKNVSLSVYQHDFLGIVGPNGGGKTTLLRILLGLKSPTDGSIDYFKNGCQVRNLDIGYLPQYNDSDRKFPISVYDVVSLGLRRKKPLCFSYTEEQHTMVKTALQKTGIENLANRPIGTLSGGQFQRVLLCRAIVSQPDLVVLDEPNTYVDKCFQNKLYEILDSINKECAIIIVSHDIEAILQNAKNIACINRTIHYFDTKDMCENDLMPYLKNVVV